MTAIVLAAVLTTAPTLPVSDGIDRTAETRGVLLEQIIAHQEYTEHMHDVWRHRRREVARAAEEAVTTTVESTAPVPTYPTSGSWADELAAVGFPASAIPTMLYIIDRESGGDPNAVNPTSGACGLIQAWPCYGGAAWLDPMTNLGIGFQKYQAAGFAPWGM